MFIIIILININSIIHSLHLGLNFWIHCLFVLVCKLSQYLVRSLYCLTIKPHVRAGPHFIARHKPVAWNEVGRYVRYTISNNTDCEIMHHDLSNDAQTNGKWYINQSTVANTSILEHNLKLLFAISTQFRNYKILNIASLIGYDV